MSIDNRFNHELGIHDRYKHDLNLNDDENLNKQLKEFIGLLDHTSMRFLDLMLDNGNEALKNPIDLEILSKVRKHLFAADEDIRASISSSRARKMDRNKRVK